MNREEIFKEFENKISRFPIPNLSQEEDFFQFCEKLSQKTRPEMEAMDRLLSTSLASSNSKMFG